MNYVFGNFNDERIFSTTELLEILSQAKTNAAVLAKTPTHQIVEVVDQVGKLWHRDGPYFQKALEALTKELSFHPKMIEQTLELIPSLCQKENLLTKIISELGDAEVLDQFRPRAHSTALVKAVPHGIVLHVSAGNVFLGCIDSLLNGFLTKNLSILKLSSQNQSFPVLFAQSIIAADPQGLLKDKFALLHWKGGSVEVETILKQEVDAVIAWGGEEMLKAYRTGLAPGVPLIEHGPKISFQVLCNEPFDLTVAAKKIADDVCTWDQAACASPQNLFIEEGIDVENLMKAIGHKLDQREIPRGDLDENEQVEILKENYRARYHSLTENGKMLQGKDWLLFLDPRPGLRPSPLNRTLILKTFGNLEDLERQVAPWRPHLQSCSYLAHGKTKEALLQMLSQAGVQRFAALGTIMNGAIGAPHDGRFALAELVRFVGDETQTDVLSFVNEAIEAVAFYRDLYEGKPVHSFDQLRPVTGKDLAREFSSAASLTESKLLRKGPRQGYYFSSGGTTGAPKYVFFSHDEFDTVGKMLAKAYQAQGLKAGTVCANLFVAGNLWSSFLAIEKALIHAATIQLPIGGNADPELILQYLEKFKPEAVFGLPSLLSELAILGKKKGLKLTIPHLYYAGEHLTPQARQLFEKNWSTQSCFSAGYASVDAGPIGYQCPHCHSSEHHLFASQVHLEIKNSEAVVTSLVRRVMPIIHLRTGDHVEWNPDQCCPCGSTDPKFLLHGRLDGQINLWSCRLQLAEIESALLKAEISDTAFQIHILDEKLEIWIETENRTEGGDSFTKALYLESQDLRSTHPFSFLENKISFIPLKAGEIPRLPRTGKIQKVVDHRGA